MISLLKDKKKIIFLESSRSPSNGSTIWSSTDEGEYFHGKKLPSGVLLDDVTFHPEKDDWLLGYDRRQATLFCSTDFGTSWRLISKHVSPSRYYWYIPETDKPEMGGYIQNPEDIKRLVHFEYQMQTSSGQPVTKQFQIKSCLIPLVSGEPCALAGRAYALLMSLSTQNPISENTLVIRDDFIFYERSVVKNKLIKFISDIS